MEICICIFWFRCFGENMVNAKSVRVFEFNAVQYIALLKIFFSVWWKYGMKNLYIEFKFVAGFQKGWTQIVTWESNIVSEIVQSHGCSWWLLFQYLQKFLSYGEMPMRCALMWIAQCAWMRVLTNLQSFVELERLLLNGLQGEIFLKGLHLFIVLEFSYPIP